RAADRHRWVVVGGTASPGAHQHVHPGVAVSALDHGHGQNGGSSVIPPPWPHGSVAGGPPCPPPQPPPWFPLPSPWDCLPQPHPPPTLTWGRDPFFVPFGPE